ncbi:hypothetical protein FRB99_001545, partial [Tulasnella sp. 403]
MRKQGLITTDADNQGHSTTFQVKHLAYGSTGCAYTVVGGFQNPVTGELEDTVAKTPRLDNKDSLPQMEIWALEA